MRSEFNRLFLQHPETVGESYLQHMAVAFSFAAWLFLAALAACMHALLPAVCEKTASRIIKHLNKRMESRH